MDFFGGRLGPRMGPLGGPWGVVWNSGGAPWVPQGGLGVFPWLGSCDCNASHAPPWPPLGRSMELPERSMELGRPSSRGASPPGAPPGGALRSDMACLGRTWCAINDCLLRLDTNLIHVRPKELTTSWGVVWNSWSALWHRMERFGGPLGHSVELLGRTLASYGFLWVALGA